MTIKLNRSMKFWGLLSAAVLFCLPATAQTYRLVPGDQIEVALIGSDTVVNARVDLDGQIRLPHIGSVVVEGRSLDEAEKSIEDLIQKVGEYVDSRAFVSIVDYAPIVVSGDVGAPGRYEYLPRMTVATALGIAGGAQSLSLSQFEIDRARAEVDGQLAIINTELTGTVVQIARLEAELDDNDNVQVSNDLLNRLPARNTARLEAFLVSERDILANNLARKAELLAHWDQELTTLAQQRDVLEQRLEVQTRLASVLSAEQEKAQSLHERGLITATQMANSEQRDAVAKDRLLELEALQVTIERGISDTRRQRAQFIYAKKEDAFLALRTARQQFEDQLIRYDRAQLQQNILSGSGISRLLEADNIQVVFEILGSSGQMRDGSAITPDSLIFPGETLLVNIQFRN